jgi:Tfp pilus assembly protein FimT
MCSRSQYGFTLFELLGALLFALVLAGLSVPALSPLLRGRTLRTAAEELEARLREEALSSMQSRVERVVLLQPDHYQWKHGDEWLTTRLAEGVKITEPEKPHPREMRFYPTGVATPLTIVISFAQKECRITVSLRGRITNSCGG